MKSIYEASVAYGREHQGTVNIEDFEAGANYVLDAIEEFMKHNLVCSSNLKRCDVNTKELTDEELEYFKPVRNGESKPQNFGFIDDKLVCLDYA